MANPQKRGWVASAVLLGVGCFAAVGVGEAAARGLGLSKTWTSYRSAPDYMSLEMSSGELIGFRRLPSQQWPAPFGTTTGTNRAGFRGVELPAPGPHDALRLVWLGDSVTEGYGVDVDERFSALVQTQLRASLRTDVESANLGVAGHSTVDEVAVWENVGAALTPDAVIVQIGDNDVAGNVLKSDAFDSNQWNLPDPGMVSTAPPCVAVRFRGDDPRCSLKQLLQRHSALYLAVAERYQSFVIRSGDGASKSVFLMPLSEEGWLLLRRVLVRLLDDMDDGVPVVLLYLPVEPRVMAPAGSAPNGLGENLSGDPELNQRATVIDATELLRGGRGLFLDEVHLTAAGHERVAAALSALLSEKLSGATRR